MQLTFYMNCADYRAIRSALRLADAADKVDRLRKEKRCAIVSGARLSSIDAALKTANREMRRALGDYHRDAEWRLTVEGREAGYVIVH